MIGRSKRRVAAEPAQEDQLEQEAPESAPDNYAAAVEASRREATGLRQHAARDPPQGAELVATARADAERTTGEAQGAEQVLARRARLPRLSSPHWQ